MVSVGVGGHHDLDRVLLGLVLLHVGLELGRRPRVPSVPGVDQHLVSALGTADQDGVGLAHVDEVDLELARRNAQELGLLPRRDAAQEQAKQRCRKDERNVAAEA